ncbi:CBM96 family carbohydrate-binding protein [Dyadobacter sandarakinus]|uniref:DNRLRE domain-containing protein n=1 Tax=Dyadobacter sandarakinus TaxID=2747268 RepID=A0ABX7I0Z3_9BACT|nr:malectin domain-containing carbohydrate-binding protein [Dyadobacter sandarakinus]QRQ99512.1 DNRLRE domain-containing protein [Dyadobacter sandarakinus]
MREFSLPFSLLLLCIASFGVIAQPAVQWDKTIGGDYSDILRSVIQTRDGGYILGGSSESSISGNKTAPYKGRFDYWIVKVAPDGSKKWDRSLGGTNEETLYAVKEAADGSFFVAGQSFSTVNRDKTVPSKGLGDIWIVKLSASGQINWQKTIGTRANETMSTMEITPDGGLAIAGTTSPPDQYGTPTNRGWFLKLDSLAELQWSKDIFVDGKTPSLNTVTLTPDGGYLLGVGTGTLQDSGGTYYLVRLTSAGNVLWTREFKGTYNSSVLQSVIATPDGGYVLGGTTNAAAGFDKSEESIGFDYWIIKITSNGIKEWENTIQGSDNDHFAGMQLTKDGGYLIAGSSLSETGLDKTVANNGYSNIWLVKLSATGSIVWNDVIGSNNREYGDRASDIIATRDGGYLLAATSSSLTGGDKTETSRGQEDYWIVKLAPESAALPKMPIRINAGGPAFTTATGKLFTADQYYAGIERPSTVATGDILNTTNDVLYRSGRISPSFSYNIPIMSGEVNVTLHFAETYFGTPGKKGGAGSRQFHVNMEGSRKLTNYDIFVAAGGAMRAVQVTFPVTVTDGLLNIDFLTGAADMPRICAIEVMSAGLTLNPIADSYVQGGIYSYNNYGTANLQIKSLTNDPDVSRAAYLKFQLPATGVITSAKLRIYGHNHENSNGINLHAFGVNDDSWTESGINKTNAPAASTPSLGSVAVNGQYQNYEIDVTSYVKAQQQSGDGMVSLLLDDPSSRNIKLVFNSREMNRAPQLFIQASSSGARVSQEAVVSETPEKEPSAIYPNPVKDQLTVSLSAGHSGPISFELINVFGNGYKLTAPQSARPGESTALNIANLPVNTGIYLLKIESETFTELVRMVIEK